MPYLIPENLCTTYGFGWSYGGTTYPVTNLIDSRHYTKFVSPASAWDVAAYDGESRIDANCLVLWSDTDDPDCTIDIYSNAARISVFTGIVKGSNFYQYELQEDSSTVNAYFVPSKPLTLRHLCIGKYYTIRPAEYYDPDAEETKYSRVTNYFGNVIFNDYKANHFKLDLRFNYLNDAEQAAMNDLKNNCWQKGLKFWYFHNTTDGNLFGLDSNGFMLAYQKGTLRGVSVQGTAVTRLEENLTASTPATQGTSLVFSDVTDSSMDLSWTVASSYPDGYLVIRKASSAPTHTPVNNSTYIVGQTFTDGSKVAYFGTDNNFSDSGLTKLTTYYYKIYAYNAKINSWYYLTSSPLAGSETTTGDSLDTPILSSPSDASYTADTTPSFAWGAVAGATGYVIEIATANTFGASIVETGTPATNSYTSVGLGNDTFYWRVKATAGATESSWSTIWSLGVLTVPILDTPADASFTSDITPTFEWADVEGATAYDIDIATDTGFTNIIQTSSPTSSTYTATDIAVDGWLYWRVRAKNGAVTTAYATYRSLELFAFRKCWSLLTNDYGTKTGISAWRNQSKWEFCGWINPIDKSAAQLIFYAYYNTSNRIVVQLSDNAATSQWFLVFYVNGATAYLSGSLHDYGSPYFIYCGFDGTQAAANRYVMSVNNSAEGTLTGTPPTAIGNGGNMTLYVGVSNASSMYYDGKIDHFAVRYNRTLLSSGERTAVYNSGNARLYQNAATFDHAWEFNAATGSDVPDTIGSFNITPAAAPNQPQSADW